MNEIEIVYVNDQPVVSSLEVARNFNKEHKNVLKDIRKLIEKGVAQNVADLFYESVYTHNQNNQEYPMYLMNKDGFSLLVMGFTGKEALEWKMKYIKIFNENERRLNSLEYSQRSTSIGEVAKLSKEVRITGEKAGVNSIIIASSLCKLWRMNGLVLNEFEHEVNQLKEREQKKPIQTQMRFELTLIDD